MGLGIPKELEETKRQLHAGEKQNKVKINKSSNGPKIQNLDGRPSVLTELESAFSYKAKKN